MKKEKFNIYEEVTNRIIAQLEDGVIPWRKPSSIFWENKKFSQNYLTNS